MYLTIGNNDINFPDSTEDLVEMKIKALNDVANIKNQIAKAWLDNKTTGHNIDDEWEFKAKSSIKYKKVIIKAIDTILKYM
jgi:hypothetical protein